MLIACGFVLGAFGGASLVTSVPQIWLKRAFATLLAYVAAQLVFADPNKRMGAVLPGVIAVGGLWLLYFVRRALGGKPQRPSERRKPPETEYFI